jgi:hypothetical protein
MFHIGHYLKFMIIKLEAHLDMFMHVCVQVWGFWEYNVTLYSYFYHR